MPALDLHRDCGDRLLLKQRNRSAGCDAHDYGQKRFRNCRNC